MTGKTGITANTRANDGLTVAPIADVECMPNRFLSWQSLIAKWRQNSTPQNRNHGAVLRGPGDGCDSSAPVRAEARESRSLADDAGAPRGQTPWGRCRYWKGVTDGELRANLIAGLRAFLDVV